MNKKNRSDQEIGYLTKTDAFFLAALSSSFRSIGLEPAPGQTDEGDFYYSIHSAEGECLLTFAQIGDSRVLYGSVLTNDIVWAAGESPLPLLGENLPGVRAQYERIAA